MLFLATFLLAWEGIWEGVALRTGYEHSAPRGRLESRLCSIAVCGDGRHVPRRVDGMRGSS